VDRIDPAPRLRLCTWNLHLGLDLAGILDAIANVRDFRDIDLIALQEASVHGGKEDAEAIAHLLGPTYRHIQVMAHVLQGQVQANALVWDTRRVEMEVSASLLLPMRADLVLSRTERAVLSMLPLQQRMSLVFDCRIDGLRWLLYVAHLDVFGYRHKLEQFGSILADLAARDPADITVIAGDLNTFRLARRPRWTRLLDAAQAAGFEDLTGEIRWTHSFGRRVPVRQKLDAIFVRSERPLLYDSWSLDLAGSDHIPVFAEIKGWG